MKFYIKPAIVSIVLISMFSISALAEDKESEFYNFIQSQFKNQPNSSLGADSSSSDTNFVIEIGTVDDVEPGSLVDVPVTLHNAPYNIGAFEFRISYDASQLSLQEIRRGPLFFGEEFCGWEYFAFRLDADSRCGDGPCPLGTIQVLGIADVNTFSHTFNCFLPEGVADFLTMKFLVKEEVDKICSTIPVRFVWYECFDNVLWIDTSPDNSTFDSQSATAKHVYWNEINIPPASTFPSYGGPPDSCITFFENTNNPLHPLIDFHNGGIFIECDDTEITIGDVNADGLPYQVADAVLFTNYFLYGESIFVKSPEDQIAATDINMDSETLKLEDLTQLIRIVLGEMDQDSTLDSTLEGSIIINDNLNKEIFIITEYVSNIIWLKIEGQVEPINYLGSLALFHTYDGTYTRVGTAKNREVGPGSIKLFSYTGEGEIVEAQAATLEGVEIALRIDDVVTSIEEPDDILPSDFTLHQNYPNPFNIETTIKFDLPRASEVEFEIINTLGQEVYNVTSRYSAGSHTIYWNGSTNLGQTVGSGVYYYRITAGDFVSSKKMMLLK